MGSLGVVPPNRLAQETSPYLLQHRDNPVDWYPWGDEALERARADDKPILLSIGYSACHWCHVMERESFEDADTAAYMNQHFVPVKVDREERPDVDAIYMEAIQGMTGHGGWPLTAFADPDGVPFYGGTYFPPEPRQGMPSFRMVMEAVAESWTSQRERIRESAERIRGQLGAIASGGIHDHVGGGFARYSVDASWLVPHFEKMLYDNALLARAYLHGWQALGHERWRETCERTLDWALREMRGPEGGFYSALDADSEGEEGRFYVWSQEELTTTLADAGLADDGERVLAYWGVSEAGNFEGRNILHVALGAGAKPPESLDRAREALYEVRSRRVWPGLDDKRLLSWNALMLAALADAGATLGRRDYLEAATAC